jgi:chromosome segregation ATPase
MKKIILLGAVICTSFFAFAQVQRPVKEISPEMKELQMQRDTAKAVFKRKVAENTKDTKHYDKIQSNNAKLKEQISAAKKAKNTEKLDSLQGRFDANLDSLKELKEKLNVDTKEVARLEKEMEKAERALKDQKENEGKEKSKGKK